MERSDADRIARFAFSRTVTSALNCQNIVTELVVANAKKPWSKPTIKRLHLSEEELSILFPDAQLHQTYLRKESRQQRVA